MQVYLCFVSVMCHVILRQDGHYLYYYWCILVLVSLVSHPAIFVRWGLFEAYISLEFCLSETMCLASLVLLLPCVADPESARFALVPVMRLVVV